MRLSERFLAKWKAANLKKALLFVQNEIEHLYGVFSDENKIEKIFFHPDKHGNMTGNELFEECMELFSLLKALDVSQIPLMDLLEELNGWAAAYGAERLEKESTQSHREKVADLITAINQIPFKKKLLLLREKENVWKIEAACMLDDYKNGSITFSDMQVRYLLLQHVSEHIRVLVVADSEEGERCIEI